MCPSRCARYKHRVRSGENRDFKVVSFILLEVQYFHLVKRESAKKSNVFIFHFYHSLPLCMTYEQLLCFIPEMTVLHRVHQDYLEILLYTRHILLQFTFNEMGKKEHNTCIFEVRGTLGMKSIILISSATILQFWPQEQQLSC